MVISSIDLKDGHVVQLKNGEHPVLARDDAESLIEEFDRYGEVAVIDLDAALGNVDARGDTKNTPLLKKLLRKGNVRTGGGIRSVERAKELVSLGAEKVIIGSSAWKKNPKAGESPLDVEFLEALVKAIGRERVIVAVDAKGGKVAVHGWTETIEVPFIEGAVQAEKYCSEILFTCVEKEGCMQGADTDAVKKLREAVQCRIVAAGGVSSAEEIVQLEKIGCDVQLGMALYTGKVSLTDAFIGCLNWDKVDLIPVIAQSVNGEVLMLGYANRAAFEKTFETNKLTFFSRTRGVLWTKGEHSGHWLEVRKLRADCDRDTVLATVVPHGGVCHTGSFTCFTGEAGEASSAGRLYDIIADRFAHPKPGSYTATLDGKRVREKILEEADELCSEAESKQDVVWEVADLFYFMNVLMYREGVTWRDVYAELDRRHKST
ncbi:phosphoribosyl-ATP diphosphatase [Treponema socranskii subsp. paredis ATCC 35535]|nr:phosphoribosyl-ATP diphosphatase [Treponema socranskii subsp. paredis ATCC 35535]